MSETFDYDDFDQFDSLQGNDLVSALRKQLKAAAKDNKTLREAQAEKERALAELTQKVNGVTLESVLKEKGAKPALAKFMKDVEPTEEAITAWLAENGELFGYDPKAAGQANGEQGSSETEGMSPEMIAALDSMQKVQKQEANAAPGLLGSANKADDFLARVGQNAKSFEDVEKAMRAAGFFNQPM
jgi:hypothetical protein